MTDPIQRVQIEKLQPAKVFYNFINEEVLPGLDISKEKAWSVFSDIANGESPQSRADLGTRDWFQEQINQRDIDHKDQPYDLQASKKFLQSINYIVPEGAPFKVGTQNVDDEIAKVAGPQLVVPVTIARFAVNAANARWGSLYDALYGSDAVDGNKPPDPKAPYDPARGQKVIDFGRNRLDEMAPLANGSHHNAIGYAVKDGQLIVSLEDGTQTGLKQPEQFVGRRGAAEDPSAILLVHNGLHAEIMIDRASPIGQSDKAGVKDIILEAALSTIIDFEDSVATVDTHDKVAAYRNWLGLMKGNLIGDFERNGEMVTRRLNVDRDYIAPDGSKLTLHGRSLMLVRNVGFLMMDDTVLDQNGEPIPEHIMDTFVTTLIGMHDLKRNSPIQNSREGSIYVVHPKSHGPEEIAHKVELCDRVEDGFGLPRNTIKLGIMDEERRTTLNLKECIRAAKDRAFFINTGFLDRTGDEIHTSMYAGPLLPATQMRLAEWMQSYETWNVDIGIECGLPGHAQIGKGMWARPDDMAAMLADKGSHPKAGASTAWVPSPTAATLHALHYHQIDVAAVQKELAGRNARRVTIDNLLAVPLADRSQLTPEVVDKILDNNSQGILGYVVRWVDQGVGCSKVPDINNTKLMEDRATLRIKSQEDANYIHHDIATPEQVMASMKRMAVVVDQQNTDDPNYRPMAPNFDDSVAFKTACRLVFEGIGQPNGYTDLLLYEGRREVKAAAALNAG